VGFDVNGQFLSPALADTPSDATMNSFNAIRISTSYAVANLVSMNPTTRAYVAGQCQNSECAVAS
jgi:hypothetical protein